MKYPKTEPSNSELITEKYVIFNGLVFPSRWKPGVKLEGNTSTVDIDA